MQIRRGSEVITLTKDEMITAYMEVQRQADIAHITKDLLLQYKDQCSEAMFNDIATDANIRDTVAGRFRKRLMETFGTDKEFECLKEAYAYIKILSN